MLTNFKWIGKQVISCLSRFKMNAWKAAWIVAVSHGVASAALPVAVGNAALPSLAPLIKVVTPAVVNIAVLTKSAIEDNPLFRDPFFRRFFDVPEKREPQVSAGSGVIVDAARGYVLTNNHVIRNAQKILVTLKDRRQLEAKLVGTDPGTDIALLKIDAKDLTAVPIGDSDNLNVGDFVVAIGNPFGLGQTVTSGIVSALGRTGLNIEGFEDFIQTDASINPGNSGGALIDLERQFHRHQHRHHRPVRWQRRHRLRRADQHGETSHGSTSQKRRSAARTHRYGNTRRHTRSRQSAEHCDQLALCSRH